MTPSRQIRKVRTLELPTPEDFGLLGIDPKTSSYADAKKAYRLAARTSHPDVCGGDSEHFRQVKGAFERCAQAILWRDAHGLASAVSVEEEGEEEEFAPDVPNWGAQGGTDVYATVPLFERFVRKAGRAVFLAGHFPERDWQGVFFLAAGCALALLVRSGVHPAGLSDLLDGLIGIVVVGRTVATPTRMGL